MNVRVVLLPLNSNFVVCPDFYQRQGRRVNQYVQSTDAMLIKDIGMEKRYFYTRNW